MNAVVTPLDYLHTFNDQNPFSFCHEDNCNKSDENSYQHSDYSFQTEKPNNNEENNVGPLSFHDPVDVKPSGRKCASFICESNERETTSTPSTMAPCGTIKSNRRSETEAKLDGISVNTFPNNNDDESSGDREGIQQENGLTFSKTHANAVISSAPETPVTPYVHMEINSVERSRDKQDGMPSDNEERNEEVQGEDSIIVDCTSVNEMATKRGNRRHRSEKSKKKKWKLLNAQEIGFHLSSSPRLPTAADKATKTDPTDECSGTGNDSTHDSTGILVEDSTEASDGDSTEAGPSLQPVIKNSEREEGDHDELDDVAFFASLGIDVHDDGEAAPHEDIWQWDGVRFENATVPISGPCKDKKQPDKSSKTSPLGIHCKKVAQDSHVIKNTNRYVCNMSRREVGVLFDCGCVSSRKTYLRPDKHRRSVKCHKAIKSKHAKINDVFNNPSKKQLYMHHRLVKLHCISPDFIRASAPGRSQPTAMPKLKVAQDWIKGIRVINNGTNQRSTNYSGYIVPPTSKPQNLNHVLAETNAPSDFEMDLVSFLLSVQDRELTPEDYEMLLRLDDSVQAKTVSKNVLDSLRTEIIGDEDSIASICTICMEPYAPGQVRKFLPCQHDFHNDCIDNWLNNSSQNCPLDGLPVDDS